MRGLETKFCRKRLKDCVIVIVFIPCNKAVFSALFIVNKVIWGKFCYASKTRKVFFALFFLYRKWKYLLQPHGNMFLTTLLSLSLLVKWPTHHAILLCVLLPPGSFQKQRGIIHFCWCHQAGFGYHKPKVPLSWIARWSPLANQIKEGVLNPWLQPSTGPWALQSQAVEMASKHVCIPTCVSSGLAWASKLHLCKKWIHVPTTHTNGATHTCLPLTWNHPLFPPPANLQSWKAWESLS